MNLPEMLSEFDNRSCPEHPFVTDNQPSMLQGVYVALDQEKI
jgi:hypothetical protein